MINAVFDPEEYVRMGGKIMDVMPEDLNICGKEKRKNVKKHYLLKQRFYGFIVLVISCISAIMSKGDGDILFVSLFSCMIGIGILLLKENYVD